MIATLLALLGQSPDAEGQAAGLIFLQNETLIALAMAAAVGMVGSAAFVQAGRWGFIGKETRDRILVAFASRWEWALFFLFGGLIAAVFQWPQNENFAPIQALVLGATWPSVLSRMLAGSGQGYLDTDASQAAVDEIDDFVVKVDG